MILGTCSQEDTGNVCTEFMLSWTNCLLGFLFVSMKAKTDFIRCIGYLSFTKDHTKLDLLQILALELLPNFLKLLKPRLHLPRSSYDLSVCDFPYDLLDIVGDRVLRRRCLQFIRTSYNFLICLLSTF